MLAANADAGIAYGPATGTGPPTPIDECAGLSYFPVGIEADPRHLLRAY